MTGQSRFLANGVVFGGKVTTDQDRDGPACYRQGHDRARMGAGQTPGDRRVTVKKKPKETGSDVMDYSIQDDSEDADLRVRHIDIAILPRHI